MENKVNSDSSGSREIKFRALIKGQHFKGFVYGYYVYSKRMDIHQIIDGNGQIHYIDIKTLGQYTGLNNKDGVEIREGDVLEFVDTIYKTKKYVTIVYNNNKCRFEGNKSVRSSHRDIPNLLQYGCVVVGNIYQNLEFLSE